MGRASAGPEIGAELASLVAATSSLDGLLARIVELTAGAVPAAVSAGVVLTAPAWSAHAIVVDERAARLEGLQRQVGAGPGPDALRAARAVEAPDLRTEPRWPAFSRAAVGAGVLAVRAVPMLVRDDPPIGVLTVYAGAPAAFDPVDRELADRIAGFATVAVVGTMRSYDDTQLSARLCRALASRRAIDQAIGIVMATQGCSTEEALTSLRATARHRGTTLQRAAADLVTRTEESARSRR